MATRASSTCANVTNSAQNRRPRTAAATARIATGSHRPRRAPRRLVTARLSCSNALGSPTPRHYREGAPRQSTVVDHPTGAPCVGYDIVGASSPASSPGVAARGGACPFGGRAGGLAWRSAGCGPRRDGRATASKMCSTSDTAKNSDKRRVLIPPVAARQDRPSRPRRVDARVRRGEGPAGPVRAIRPKPGWISGSARGLAGSRSATSRRGGSASSPAASTWWGCRSTRRAG